MALQHPTTALLGHQHDEDVRMTACPYVLRGLHAIHRTSMLEAQHIDQSMPYKAYENQLLYYGLWLSILELHIWNEFTLIQTNMALRKQTMNEDVQQ